jgi:hypothetical protein
VTIKLDKGSLRQTIRIRDAESKTEIMVKIGIEKTSSSNEVFLETIPELVLCGTDDLVPGIKNNGHIAIIERVGLG